jgi:hypothetical protein
MTEIYDRTREPSRRTNALRDKPLVVRLLVCLAAFAIPIAVAAVADRVLHFPGSQFLYLGLAGVAFVMLLLGPLDQLGAIDLGEPPRDHPEIPGREYLKPWFMRDRKRAR